MSKLKVKKLIKFPKIFNVLMCVLLLGLIALYSLNKNCVFEQGKYLHSNETYVKRYCLPSGWKNYSDYEYSISKIVSPEVRTIIQTGEIYHPDVGAAINISSTLWRPPGMARENFQEYYNLMIIMPKKPKQTLLKRIPHPRYEAYDYYYCESSVCSESRILVSGNNFVRVSYTCAECNAIDVLYKSIYYDEYHKLVSELVF